MRIEKVILNNFKVYKGKNEIIFSYKPGKNISLIAGKNGYGKTTFLTSLIWCFYGNLMVQVEDKYKQDIKNVGGYDLYLKTLFNKNSLIALEADKKNPSELGVEVHLTDVLIPSIPCKQVVISRTFNLINERESLSILIDGQENELTKNVGYDIFINDFILPREISKFFFFDAEKIVSLAEAKTKAELRTLSKAYSEVLGIKKYEDLKTNLNSLLTKLRRSGVSKLDKEKLEGLIKRDEELSELIELNNEKIRSLDNEMNQVKVRIDQIQEKLIREGNDISLEDLKVIIKERDNLKKEHKQIKDELGSLLDIIPVVIAGKKLDQLVDRVILESKIKESKVNHEQLNREIRDFSSKITNELKKLDFSLSKYQEIESVLSRIILERNNQEQNITGNILLDFDDNIAREISATHQYIKESFQLQFSNIVKKEKDTKLYLAKAQNRIKQAEARKNNPLAQTLREDKIALTIRLDNMLDEKHRLIENQAILKQNQGSNLKVLSEYEKNFNLVENDKKKYDVTVQLLNKLNILTNRIKEEKKYSLQKAILLGLKKLMHKEQLISDIRVRIEDDIMDIDLLGPNGMLINKDELSKGEQQLYATALLKALVDESGINFPVFIDSPLQKFDKQHSRNVINEFYPSVSEQVVLFPLLEKELTFKEFEQLKPKLCGVYLIENEKGSSKIEKCKIDELFIKFNEQNYVYSD